MSDTMKRMWTDRQIRSMADESAKIRIEAGLTENAKPIYVHPITLVKSTGDDKFMLNLMILSNQAEPYTKETLVTHLKSIDSASWLTTGAYITATYYLSPSAIRYANEKLALYGIDNGGTIHSPTSNLIDMENLISLTAVALEDGVNKIN